MSSSIADAAGAFLAAYGGVIEAALALYERRMLEAAREAELGYRRAVPAFTGTAERASHAYKELAYLRERMELEQ